MVVVFDSSVTRYSAQENEREIIPEVDVQIIAEHGHETMQLSPAPHAPPPLRRYPSRPVPSTSRTKKPPEMLTVEISTAPAPTHSAVVCGTKLGPSRYMPPTAVRPEMALVTAMRGECRACVTPSTTCGQQKRKRQYHEHRFMAMTHFFAQK